MSANKGHHGFASYNKFDSQGALIGNYVEERALDATTGCHRYPRWVDHKEEQESVYAKTVTVPTDNPTYTRVMEHTDREDPQQWVSQAHDTYRGPNRPDLEVKNVTTAKMGRREQMELQRLYQEAAALPENEPTLHSHDTEQRTQYIPIDMTGMKIGAKVMKTQDGLETVTRDPTFLAEHEIIPRSTVDRLMPEGSLKLTARQTYKVPEEEEDTIPYHQDLGVSLYSEAVYADTYKGTRVHGTKIVGGNSPFARNCDFSKPIGEYNKVVEDE